MRFTLITITLFLFSEIYSHLPYFSGAGEVSVYEKGRSMFVYANRRGVSVITLSLRGGDYNLS